jgi:hypothetical protein
LFNNSASSILPKQHNLVNILQTNSTCQSTLAFFQLFVFKHIHHSRRHRMSLHVHVHVKPLSYINLSSFITTFLHRSFQVLNNSLKSQNLFLAFYFEKLFLTNTKKVVTFFKTHSTTSFIPQCEMSSTFRKKDM